MTFFETAKRFSIGIHTLRHGMDNEILAIVRRLDGEAIVLESVSHIRECCANQALDALVVDLYLLAEDAYLREAIQLCVTPLIVFVENLSNTESALDYGATDVFSYALNRELLARRLENNLIAYRARRQITTYRGRFETLYDNAPVMMHVLSREGVILRVNRRWSEVLGYAPEQIEGKPYSSIVDTSLSDQLNDGLEYFFETGHIHDLATGLYAADGTLHHFMVDASTFLDASGETVAVTMLRDVTDIQHTQVRLRESTLLYRALVEAASDAILLIDTQTGHILEANEPASKMLGYSVDELQQLSMSDLEASNMLIQGINASDDTATAFLDDMVLKRKNGTVVPVESSSRIVRFEGKVALLATLRDITLRQNMLEKEKSTRIMAETLRDSAATFTGAYTVDDVLDIAIDMVRRVIPAPVANVSRLINDNVVMVRWIGYDKFGFTDAILDTTQIDIRNASHITKMLQTNQALYLPDVRLEGWPNIDAATGLWVRSYLAVPIHLHGEVYGFLNLDSPEVNAFTAQHVESIQVFAGQVSIALEKAVLLDELKTAKSSLEQTVNERTEALIQANRSLRRYIDELRTTQESLQQERSLLKKIIDSIADMIYVKDGSGQYILANHAAITAMGGKTIDDIVGRSLPDFYDPAYAAYHKIIDDNILATGEPVRNLDNTMRYADGTLHRQLLSKQPLYDAQGNIIGIVGINRDITELKIIEQHLREEREQLAQVLRSARCLLWTATLTLQDGNLVWALQVVNEDAAQELLSLNLEGERYSARWPASIVEEDAQRREYTLRTHIQFERQNFSHEIRCKASNGNLVWLAEDIMITPLSDHEWRLVGICTDITERKAAEAALQTAYDDLERRIQMRMAELLEVNNALREEIAERQRAEDAERRQRLLAEALTQSLATLNSSFDQDALFDYLLDSIEEIIPHRAANIMLVNSTRLTANVVRLRGYPNIEVMRNTNVDISLMPDKMHILQHGTHYIIHDTRSYPGWSNLQEFEWIRSALSVPITLDEGVIGFLNVDSDITNAFTVQHADWLTAFANQAALALRNARLVDQIRGYAADLERVAQSRTAQLRAVLGSIRDGLIYHNLDQEAQYINRALIEMLGYSSDEWMSNSLNYQRLLDGDSETIDRLIKKIEMLLETRGYVQEEAMLRRKDGTTFPALATRMVVRDEDNVALGTLTLLRDISEEKTLQEQRERFIANASHELRTPIANMKTRLYLMSRKPESIPENLEIIVKVTNWMQRLVDDMFDLSRFQRGLLELQREPHDIRTLLRETMVFHQPEAERKDILLALNAPTDPVIVSIDPYRLMQVFGNLVSNAIHYTPVNGQVSVEISMPDANGNKELTVAVSDSGSGIAPEHLEHLFKPFYRGTTESRGAGLGLSIAQEIVALHGGRIVAESTVDVGSRFTVYLPANLVEPADSHDI